MKNSNPIKRLIQKENIWNLAVINNIDFKKKSFKFDNIYDITCSNSYATLQMAFQTQLSIKI